MRASTRQVANIHGGVTALILRKTPAASAAVSALRHARSHSSVASLRQAANIPRKSSSASAAVLRLARSHSSMTSGPPPERLSALLKNALIAVGLGVGIHLAMRERRDEIPQSVQELCASASKLRKENAPLSAAAKYEQAFNVLTVGSADPLLLAEVLLQWGEAQWEAKAMRRAAATMHRARGLLSHMMTTLPPDRLTLNDVPRKTAAVLDRLAELERQAGRQEQALLLMDEAIEVVSSSYPSLGLRASLILSGDTCAALGCVGAAADNAESNRSTALQARLCRKERHAVTDAAGLHHNRSELLLENSRAEEAAASAMLALALVTAARNGCLHDARQLAPLANSNVPDCTQFFATEQAAKGSSTPSLPSPPLPRELLLAGLHATRTATFGGNDTIRQLRSLPAPRATPSAVVTSAVSSVLGSAYDSATGTPSELADELQELNFVFDLALDQCIKTHERAQGQQAATAASMPLHDGGGAYLGVTAGSGVAAVPLHVGGGLSEESAGSEPQ